MAQIEDNAEDGSYTDLWSRPGFLIRRLHQLHIAIFLEECGDYDVTLVELTGDPAAAAATLAARKAAAKPARAVSPAPPRHPTRPDFSPPGRYHIRK